MYDYYKNEKNAGAILGSSLGNMGFSETKCASASMLEGNYIDLEC